MTTMTGSDGDDVLIGSAQNDTLSGGAGDDWLEGGAGQDNLTGGTGADRFVFRETPYNTNYDRIFGFVSGTDAIWLDEEVFANAGAPGRITYDTANGNLYYDADGSGAGRAMLIGILHGAPALAASDIVVFDDAPPPPPEPGDTIITHERYFTLPPGIANVIVRDPLEPAGFSDGDIQGNALDNVIRDETSGADFMWLNGMAGDDTVFGGSGPDMFVFYNVADPGNDVVDGGSDYDRLWVGWDSAVVVDVRAGTVAGGGVGGAGSVRFSNFEEYLAGDFDDRLVADDSGVTLMGLDGDDTLTGGAGNDELWGEGGFELWSGDGHDLIFGGAGNDTLLGNNGNDTLYGGPGTDLVNLAFSDPLGDQELGSDTVVFAEAPSSSSADRITGFQPGADRLAFNNETHANLGGAGNFSAGDARFFAGAGASAGRDPSDRVIYDTTTGRLWYDADGSGALASQLVATLESAPQLAATDISVVGNGGASPGSGEKQVGTGGADRLIGGEGHDTLMGLAGNDTLAGNAGDDWLEGGTGQDQMTGGAGADSFVFRDTPFNTNYDRVFGFASGSDELLLDHQAFANAGGAGGFSGADPRFFAAAGAASGHDADDRIIYNTSNGNLYYDADGSGGGRAMFIGILHGGPDLEASDIAII